MVWTVGAWLALEQGRLAGAQTGEGVAWWGDTHIVYADPLMPIHAFAHVLRPRGKKPRKNRAAKHRNPAKFCTKFYRTRSKNSRLARAIADRTRRRYTEAMTTEITIELDRKHRAIRSGDRWALLRRLTDGTYDTLETWAGNRRSIYHKCEKHGIVPDRQADTKLATLPESIGFRDR